MKSDKSEILSQIEKDGALSKELEAKVKDAVVSFTKNFS